MTERRNVFVVVIISIIMCMFLAGCSENHESKDISDDDEKVVETQEYEVSPLIEIVSGKILDMNEESSGCTQYVFYDPETLIMYSHFSGMNDEGLIEMHEADGTPRTYKNSSDAKLLIMISREKILDTEGNSTCYKQYTFYDPVTLVMYVHYTGMSDVGISELHNADGTLRTFNRK